MPYVEVWVEANEFDKKQIAAIAELVSTSRRIALRLWPSEDARDLEDAANRVVRAGVLLDKDYTKQIEFPADTKYRAWQLAKTSATREER